MGSRAYALEIFAVSAATLLLEISYTRVFSFKLYYFFTYFLIGIGLLGLGSGGVMVAVSRRLREAEPSRLITTLCTLGGLAVAAGYAIVAPLPLNASQLAENPAEIAKLLFACLVLVLPFLGSGMIVTTILSRGASRVNWLYGADLVGAALGCAVVVPLLGVFTPPGCVLLAGAILAAAALPLAARQGGARFALSGLVVLALLVPVLAPALRPPSSPMSPSSIGVPAKAD